MYIHHKLDDESRQGAFAGLLATPGRASPIGRRVGSISSRGDRMAIELLIAGVRAWETRLRRTLLGMSTGALRRSRNHRSKSLEKGNCARKVRGTTRPGATVPCTGPSRG